MTAPQKYSVLEEKDRKENAAGKVLQEAELQTDRPKSIVQQIDSAVGYSQRDLFVLGFVSEMLIADDDGKDNSLCTGYLVKDYVEKIQERLGLVEELVCSIRRLENEACI